MAREIADVIQQVQALPEGQVYSKAVHDAIAQIDGMNTFADVYAFLQSEGVQRGNDFSQMHRSIHDLPSQEGRKYQDFMNRLGRLRPLPVRTIDYI